VCATLKQYKALFSYRVFIINLAGARGEGTRAALVIWTGKTGRTGGGAREQRRSRRSGGRRRVARVGSASSITQKTLQSSLLPSDQTLLAYLLTAFRPSCQ
jgi:hypothetical protein